jgi:hypothetical protein
VQVVVYDTSGRAQDVVLRAVQIGEVRGPATLVETGLIARCHIPEVVRWQRRIDLAGSGC